MGAPWEKYTAAASGGAPWEKYSGGAADQGSDGVPGSPAFEARQASMKSEYAAKTARENSEGVGDKLRGAGEAFVGAATGMMNGIGAPFQGAVDYIRGKAPSWQAGTEAELDRGGYQPSTETGRRYLGNIGHAMENIPPIIPEVPVGVARGMAAKPFAGAAKREIGEVAGKVAASPEGDMLRRGAGAVKSAVTPKIDPEVMALANKAQEFGIPLRPDMLTNNKIMRMMGDALEKVPVSGSKSEARAEAFNRALIKQIGGDPKARKLTPDVYAQAMDKSGTQIGAIAERNSVQWGGQNAAKLRELIADPHTGDVKDVLKQYVSEIYKQTNQGVMPGVAFRKINSKIGRQLRSTSNGDLKAALSDLQDLMHDALETSIPTKDLEALQVARTQYAKGKTIEALVAKSPTGDVSPSGLMGRVTADSAGKRRMAMGRGGDMGDLARIGQRFVAEPSTSNTAERGLAYGLLGGGAFIDPTVASGLWGAANLYNRLGPRMIPKPPGQ